MELFVYIVNCGLFINKKWAVVNAPRKVCFLSNSFPFILKTRLTGQLVRETLPRLLRHFKICCKKITV